MRRSVLEHVCRFPVRVNRNSFFGEDYRDGTPRRWLFALAIIFSRARTGAVDSGRSSKHKMIPPGCCLCGWGAGVGGGYAAECVLEHVCRFMVIRLVARLSGFL